MLEENKKLSKLLTAKQFRKRLHAVNVDEAHCISQWGETFRPSYSRLGSLRALFPPETPFFITSATLPPKMLDDVKTRLGFRDDCATFVISNNRPNIYLEVREMKHPKLSFRDLDFVLNPSAKKLRDLKRTIVYFDT